MKKVPVSSARVKVGFKGIVTTTAEEVLGWEFSPETYNFRFEDGMLKGNIGVENAKGHYASVPGAGFDYPALPSGVTVKDVFVYTRRHDGEYDDKLILQCTDGSLYHTGIFSSAPWTKINTDYLLLGDATAVNYNYDGNDVLLLSSASCQLAVLNDTTLKAVPDAPRLSSLAVHYERVYGTQNEYENKVWFSDDFNPENWTVASNAAGYVSFADECGDALAVVSFLNYLYIFREHGIFRLTAYGDQQEFSLKKLFTGTGRIYKNTIALCGDRIMFLTDDGVMTFDGYDVRPAIKELPELASAYRCMGAYHDGCYFLLCTTAVRPELSVDDTPGCNNTVLRYSIKDGATDMLTAGYFFTMRACRTHTACDLLLALTNPPGGKLGMLSKRGEFFGTPLKKLYRTPCNDLNVNKFKIIRSVNVTTMSDLELTVITDDRKKTYTVKGSSLPQTVFVDRGGKNVGLELRSSMMYAEIAPLTVNLDFM